MHSYSPELVQLHQAIIVQFLICPMLTDNPQVLLDQTEALLQKWKHPDPYRPPTAPGGSKYERNLPPPMMDRKFSLSSGTSLHTFDPCL